ncbi:MAG: LysR family transcriptional regulator [Pseudomonadota bacterium]
MNFENWDEVRTAYQVARLGTVSGAADVLGVHHATVIRHIDALEGRLGAKLFQRHARGYTPTEAGRELMKIAQVTEDQFSQLAARIQGVGSDMAGEMIVTSLPGLSPLVTPTLARLQAAHPQLSLRYASETRVFRLEYGEAHIAIRAGARPQEPDNVVQPFVRMPFGLYASQSYLDAFGRPENDDALVNHRFVASLSSDARAPFFRWLAGQVPPDRIMFRTNDETAMRDAVEGGVGLGFLSPFVARKRPALIEVMPPRDEWTTTLWLVTHIDLHRTPKIQAVLAALKEDARHCTEI